VNAPTGDKGRLVLVRHGQGSLGTDNYDRLSPIGWQQSNQLGERLRSSHGQNWHLESGSLVRHQQTVEGMAHPTKIINRINGQLNEYTVDHLIQSALAAAQPLGISVPPDSAFANPKAYLETFLEWFPEVLAHWQSGQLVCEQNGLWSAFHQRVTAPITAWRDLVGRGQTIVAVTSAGVISTIIADALSESLDWQRQLNVTLYNASVSELSLGEDGNWRIDVLNCLDHIANPDHHTLA